MQSEEYITSFGNVMENDGMGHDDDIGKWERNQWSVSGFEEGQYYSTNFPGDDGELFKSFKAY